MWKKSTARLKIPVLRQHAPGTAKGSGRLTSGKANLPANRSVCDEFGQQGPEIDPPINLQSLDFCLEVYTEVYKS
jgi:hypothetical protein